jgi:uncharacterized membrane protein YfcA
MLRPRWWLFWFGLVLIGVALWLTLTPTIWNLEGRQDESYPELFVVAFGIPTAVIITLIGLGTGLLWKRGNGKRGKCRD